MRRTARFAAALLGALLLAPGLVGAAPVAVRGRMIAPGVAVIPGATVAPGVAAFPRLRAAPSDHAAARINAALAAGDGRVREAAASCHGWTRDVAVTMRGPRFLTLVATDEWACGAYPDHDVLALTYDLRTGAPVNWTRVLGRGIVQAETMDSVGDGTRVGAVISKALAAWYRNAALGGAVVPGACRPVLDDPHLGFQVWPDARAGGLEIAAFDLPHVVAVCAPPLVVSAAALRAMGVDAGLVRAILAAHRAGRFGPRG